MAILSSSPLNLTLDSSASATSGKIGSYPATGVNIKSLFNSPRKNTILWTPWPTGAITTSTTGGYGTSSSSTFITHSPAGRSTLHSDNIYDISTTSIIDFAQNIKNSYGSKGDWYPMWLKPIDFAYLRDVGVFPNNRLIICRRFDGPVGSDLTLVQDEPISTMISWVPEGKDFMDFSFGEEWEEAAASLTDIFNSAGKDVASGSAKDGLGAYLAEGAFALPLPGFTEMMQRKILEDLGIIKKGDASTIPSGDPNLIKQAQQRKLVDYDQAGSGLHCSVSIEVESKWEQKFINGVDPTLAWMDILQTILRFGTSPARFYLGSGNQTAALEKFLEDFQNHPVQKIKAILKSMIGAIGDLITKVVDTLKQSIANPSQAKDKLVEFVKEAANSIIDTMVDKYKVKILGVFKALTGSPSGSWHVSIGNPKRPTFCSGDMICKKVQITMGDKLAFNDLPSSITAKFTLENARPLGLQEVLQRFNSGYSRTVTVRKTIEDAQGDLETSYQDNPNGNDDVRSAPNKTASANAIPGSPQVGGDPSKNGVGSGQNNSNPNYLTNLRTGPGAAVIAQQTGPSGTRVGSQEKDNMVCNPDANSSTPLVTDNTQPQSIAVSPTQNLSTFDSGRISKRNSYESAENSLLNIKST